MPRAAHPESALRPGVRSGSYPQRKAQRTSALDRHAAALFAAGRTFRGPGRHSTEHIAAQVATAGDSWTRGQEAEQLLNLRRRLRAEGLIDRLVFQCFALIRARAETALGVRHFDEQLLAGWLILQGMLAQMSTGEGKTLAATLPACTAGLAGIPTHVITSNEYLAQRDAHELAPLYRSLGLSSGAVTEAMDTTSKRAMYGRDIVHLAGKQLGFDYLRDRMAQARGEEPPMLRGLCFAIVDEADSILIDEAVTPLIIARDAPDGDRLSVLRKARDLALDLERDRHFELARDGRTIGLLEAGQLVLEARRCELPPPWNSRRRSESLLITALRAEHGYQPDRDYLVRNGRLIIIDANSGRGNADRAWPEGLQQFMELKEGCRPTPQRETLASISYQRLFRRYLRVGGMSGTLQGIAGELDRVYGLRIRTVPLRRPCRRECGPLRVFTSGARRRPVLLARVAELAQGGVPVLLVTGSVAGSEALSRELKKAGLEHKLLNAHSQAEEAAIIATAGGLGRITVATQMAGRGTDIVLGPGAEALDGLHVLLAEAAMHPRQERQIRGRTARQGDPGRIEFYLSLEDPLFRRWWPPGALRLLSMAGGELPRWLGACLLKLPQHRQERRHRADRAQLLRREEQLEELLAVGGPLE